MDLRQLTNAFLCRDLTRPVSSLKLRTAASSQKPRRCHRTPKKDLFRSVPTEARREEYGRTFARMPGGSGGLEVWWRLPFNDNHFHNCLLVARPCALLMKQHKISIGSRCDRPQVWVYTTDHAISPGPQCVATDSSSVNRQIRNRER